MIKFASGANTVVGPIVIDSLATAQAQGTLIRSEGGGFGGTAMTAAFNLAATELSGSPYFDASLRQVVNVVTDGNPNSSSNAVTARDGMISTLGMTTDQDEIDAEAIGTFLDINFLRDEIVYPQPGYLAPPFDEGGGWVREVANAQELADTMCEKFQVITAEAEISVTKTCTGPFVPGETFTCDVAVTNAGPDEASVVIVTDGWRDADPFLDSATYADPPGVWACSGDGDLTCSRQGLMPVGTENMRFTFVLPEDAHYNDPNGDLVFTNVIDITAANDPTPNFAVSYDYTMEPSADAAADIALLTPDTAAGGVALFEVAYFNYGPSDMEIGVASLTLNGPASFVNPLDPTWMAGVRVPVDQYADATIAIQVDDGASPGDLIELCTEVSPDFDDPDLTNNGPICATLEVGQQLPDADLAVSVTKTSVGPAVPGGDLVSFEIDVTNLGDADAYGAILAFSVLDLPYINVDNITAADGWTDFGPGNIFLATQPVEAGTTDTFSVHLRFTADAHYASYGWFWGGEFQAQVAATNPDPDPGNNLAGVFLDKQLQADLTIEKTLLNDLVWPGQMAEYEIVVCNEGPSDVAGVAVEDFPGLNLIAGSLVLSSDADDLYIAAGDCVDVMATVKVKSGVSHPAQFCNKAKVDASGVDAGVTTLAPIVNEPETAYVCGTVGERTMWYGPVTMENECTNPVANFPGFFADCNGDGVVDFNDVTVYVNGVQVPVLAISPLGYVLLETDYGHAAEVTIDYCYTEWVFIEDQLWQWINIETQPWHFTEFVLPQRPDKPTTPPYDKGDYILVSSWITEDDVRMKFVFDPEIGMIHAADIYVNDAEYNSIFKGVDANTLRVYGRDDVNAAFPYTRADGPFNIGNENWEKPGKDFVVFNPAFLDGWRYPIKADGDANQKVHLRMWYVPEYLEPAGYTEPTVPEDRKVSNLDKFGDGDIVMEYTYLLLDKDTNNPIAGSAQGTKMMFPMAGFHPDIANDPIGLDSYDVNSDRQDDIMSIEAIFPNFAAARGGLNAVVVSPEGYMGNGLEIGVGDTIQFLDFAITLDGISSFEGKADLRVDYIGWRKNFSEYVGNVQLWQRNSVFPDADTDAALVSFLNNKSIIRGDTFWPAGMWGFWGNAEPVSSPFFFVLEYVGEEVVEVKPYRWLQEGETFFVDGAEYDVAKIHLVANGLKYITIRNPIPKCADAPCQDIQIPVLTRYKSRVLPYPEMLPVLPPFDRQHDIVDDVNIPEIKSGPDVQYPDNDAGEAVTCGPTIAGAKFGCTSGIHAFFNTIEERLVADQAALAIGWMEEAKETRFDTNLFEEKFTKPACEPETDFMQETIEYKSPGPGGDYGWYGYTTYEIEQLVGVTVEGVQVPVLGIGTGRRAVLLEQKFAHNDAVIQYYYLTGDEVCTGQEWRWINIETMPWHYTEFVLPEIDEAAPLEDLGFIGDYILVSSFVTQDGVRAKFSYDATDGTGIYVNHCLSELGITSLTANPMVVPLGVPIEFEATVTGMPLKYEWDFGGAGTLQAGGQETGTFLFSEPGQFQVFLTVSDDCLTRSAFVNVEVQPLNADVNKDGVVNFEDLLEVLRHWGNDDTMPDWAEHEHADVNEDGRVNILDILLVLQVLLS